MKTGQPQKTKTGQPQKKYNYGLPAPLEAPLKCPRCHTINEFYIEHSGPHLKASCNNCDGFIKFLKQIDTSNLKQIHTQMAKDTIPVSMRLELTQINKEHLYTSEKTGKVYIDLVGFLNLEEKDSNGLNGIIKQQANSATREKEKGKGWKERTEKDWPILGSFFIFEKTAREVDDEALPPGATKPVAGVTTPVTDAQAKAEITKGKLPF